MTTIFRNRIHTALRNPILQAALDGNAERRLQARLEAQAAIPEEERQAIRQRAHAVRADIIANLESYLDQFIAKAQANGLIVHRATDGLQAVQVVRQIVRQHQAKVIAKSKTMVGEEIHLNQALESDGILVVETDLGEYIVQLREEPPSHIITPAVHLTRQEVGQTFAEKLGIPYTDDIPSLTAVARRVLRQTFLDADIGISGVNFGVVESGTLCLVTNEGNGRMCTTLPKVHIALMGIERILPTLDDLALMLGLLPSSATGQKLSVYTSLINSPRRPEEIDGALERHLVLLDNGRQALRKSPLVEALYCIRCGACLNACPVFREIGGHAYVGSHGQNTPYPGPIGSALSPGLFGISEFGHLARASSLCGACKEACPIDIDLPKLLLRVRAAGGAIEQVGEVNRGSIVDRGNRVDKIGPGSHVPRGLGLGLRLFTWAATSPRRFVAAQRLAGIFSRLLPPFTEWLRLPAFTGWGYGRDFPRPALTPFQAQFSQLSRLPLPQHSSNSASQRPDAPSEPGSLGAQVKPAPTSKTDRFASELTALGGSVSRCQSEELAGCILAFLQKLGVTTIQAWDEAHLPGGLLEALYAGGIQIHHTFDPSIRVGITGALAGIAETGSLVLTGGAGQPLSASLLPEFHIAILHQEDLYQALAEVMNLPQIRQATSAVIITGPSRTADIEMALTIGVHGPREVHVFLF